MAARNALALVNFTRTLVGVFERDKLRDGFAADELQADRDILSNINEGVRELLDTGYSQCYFTLTLSKADTDDNPYEYGLSAVPHTVMDVRLGSSNAELTFTSIGALNREHPGWRTSSRGTPTHYYFNGHFMGIWPKPTLTTETVIFLAEALVDDLALATDEPARLPEQFHTVPCYFAASVLCRSFAQEGLNTEAMTIAADRNMARFAEEKEKLAQWVNARHSSDTDRKFVPSEPRYRRPWR